jgi:hypothetical protein
VPSAVVAILSYIKTAHFDILFHNAVSSVGNSTISGKRLERHGSARVRKIDVFVRLPAES